MARSLLDGLDVDKKSAARKASAGKSGSAGKLYVAVGLLVVAVGILVWYYGLRGDGAPTITVDPVEVQQAQQEAQKAAQEAKSRGMTVTGND
jgi:hypothetical protein